MAHFAQLDANNVVLQAIVVDNRMVNGLPYPESEPLGIDFCKTLYGQDTVWVQTSYNGTFRQRFAKVGGTYDSAKDIFIDPKPPEFSSFVIDATGRWIPPIAHPNDGAYLWDEPTVSWKAITKPYPSWTFSNDPLVWWWIPPVPYPDDFFQSYYVWDEANLTWVKSVRPTPPPSNQ